MGYLFGIVLVICITAWALNNPKQFLYILIAFMGWFLIMQYFSEKRIDEGRRDRQIQQLFQKKNIPFDDIKKVEPIEIDPEILLKKIEQEKAKSVFEKYRSH